MRNRSMYLNFLFMLFTCVCDAILMFYLDIYVLTECYDFVHDVKSPVIP